MRRAAELEAGVWRSLYRWIGRRPFPVLAEITAFSYFAGVAPVMWVFIAISAVEIPILHLLLPAGWWRVFALVLGAWGLLWMVGLLASLRMPPHLLGPDGARLRYGTSIDVIVPWAAVETVTRSSRNLLKSRSVQVENGEHGDTVMLVVNSQTNIDIQLREPVDLPLRRCQGAVVRVRCYADDPAAFVARARRLASD